MNVLVVEDSKVVATYIRHVLQQDESIDFKLVPSGEEAIESVEEHPPDVILMDLHLPGMSGIQAIEHIMEHTPCPIVVLSGNLGRSDTDLTFESFRAGAVKVLSKPEGMEEEVYERFSTILLRHIKLMAGVKVVHRKKGGHSTEHPSKDSSGSLDRKVVEVQEIRRPEIVVLGASTGGPALIQNILSGLAPDFNIPLLIAQHISDGFEEGLRNWLSTSTDRSLSMVSESTDLSPGKIYLAPQQSSIYVRDNQTLGLKEEPLNALSPCIDLLLESAAEVFGNRALGILCTGMGSDGTRGLGKLREAGSQVWVQKPATAVVQSMPQEAIRAGYADRVLSPAQIIEQLNWLNQLNIEASMIELP
ncbi:MAG: chemotaxis protein CheB [Bacteroidota bacterium]